MNVGKGMAVPVGNGEGDIEGVREGGSSYVMVGVNVVVFVGVTVFVAVIAGSVKMVVIVLSFVPSGVLVNVGVLCPCSRFAFHINNIPKQ